jgi:hypothetical protein
LQNTNLEIYNNVSTPQIYESKQIQYAEILPVKYMQTQIINEDNTISQTQYSLYQPQTQSFGGPNQFIQTGTTYEQPIYQPSQVIQTSTTSDLPKFGTNISNTGYQTTNFVTSQSFGTIQNNVPNASNLSQVNQLDSKQNTEIKQSQNEISKNDQIIPNLSVDMKDEFMKEYNKLDIQKTQILKEGENPINEESKEKSNLENEKENKDNKVENNNDQQE